jgi:hypothetical protein
VPTGSLDDEVESLVASIAAKATGAVRATIAHVDAVTGAMIGRSTAWADDDLLAAAGRDPEAVAAAGAALERFTRR